MTDPDKTQFLPQAAHRAPAPAARLVAARPLPGVPERIPLTQERVTLECGPEGRVRISGGGSPNVWLMQYGGAWAIESRSSDLRVLVNGSPVTLSFLKPGDQIDLGGSLFVFELDAGTEQHRPRSPTELEAQSHRATSSAKPGREMAPAVRAAGQPMRAVLRALRGTPRGLLLWMALAAAAMLALGLLLAPVFSG